MHAAAQAGNIIEYKSCISMCEAESSGYTVMSPTTNSVSNSTTLEQLSSSNKQQMIEVRRAMYNGNNDESPSGSDSSSSSGSGSDRDSSPVLQDYPEQSRGASGSLQMQGELANCMHAD